ncbi:MAG TPA: EVE domain-containing protein [Candidatus Acidoferrales bacterium]|nr:EVE domain-containing protein [Candidatus Acidoferrales bacterium]
MNYWIFQSVTERYDLRETLQEGKEETWVISRYWQQMLPGDLVFFWLGGPPAIRGIYGWAL